MTKKICMTGGNGRVGRLLAPHGVVDLGCDVTNPLDVQRSIKYLRPKIIVHLASHSDIDWCDNNIDKAVDVNFIGASNVVAAAEQVGCSVVLLSSDHVFNGRKWWGKCKEGDERAPLNQYGMTKVAAEGLQSVFDNLKVVRTSYLFDYKRLKEDIVYLKRNKELTYPTFIKRSFMYAPHFVQSFLTYLSRYDEMPDILHISGSRIVSWHQFMSMVANKFKLDITRVVPRNRDKPEEHAPRGYRLGLDVRLSERLGLPQFDYIDGISQMKVDSGR